MRSVASPYLCFTLLKLRNGQLLPFLRDRNPQARQLALSNLLGQAPKGSPHRNIFLDGLRGGGLQGAQDNEVIRDLKIPCRDQLVRSSRSLKHGPVSHL